MLKSQYHSDSPGSFDPNLKKGIEYIRDHIKDKDDDFLMLIIGNPGTGKSNLGEHILEEYTRENLSVDLVAFSQDEFATTLKKVSMMAQPKALLYDEANVQKRDSLSKWNKRLLDLYYTIRGENILHIWANPSLNMIDAVFIKERIKAVIFVKGNEVNKPRLYWYFRKNDFMRILTKYETLDINILNRVKGEYAYYRGWFKKYDGKIADDYLKKKNARMKSKIDDFYADFAKTDINGDVKLTVTELANKLGVTTATINRYIRDKKLVQGEHFVVSLTGNKIFNSTSEVRCIEIIKENLECQMNATKNFQFKKGSNKPPKSTSLVLDDNVIRTKAIVESPTVGFRFKHYMQDTTE